MKNVKASTALGLVLAAAIQVAPWTIHTHAWADAGVPPVQSANRNTGIDVTPGGTPIVNIATPRADGTSYNVFERLNVGKEGLVFNNSPTIGVSTIGGQILPNANLVRSGQSASLIVNEVMGGDRSTLAGTLEIFGPKAALIIANPSGITCDGCGFINISHVALSSGRITFGKDGSFAGFQVDGGDVTITGNGLFAGNVDYFDIVTEAARVNAGIYARDLVIAGGRSNYDYAERLARARAGGNDRLAIDSSLLGGMYANRIRLIGTGAGVGINLKGTVAALGGPVEIEAGGRIGISNLASASHLTVKSHSGDIAVAGQIYSAGSAMLDAGGSISYSGPLLAASGSVRLNAGGDISLSGTGGLYSGLDSAGRIGSDGAIQLGAGSRVSIDANQLIAPGRIGIAGASLTLGTGSLVSSSDITIGSLGEFDAAGVIAGQRNISLAANRLALSGNIVANGGLELTASSAAVDGTLLGLGRLGVQAREGLSIGSTGLLQSNGIVDISGGGISNAGRVVGVQGVMIGATGNVTSTGTLLSGFGLALASGKDLDLSGALAADRSVALVAADRARIDAKVAAAGDISVSAGSADITGSLSTNGMLAVQTSGHATIGTGAALVADGRLSISGTDLTIAGAIDASGGASLALSGGLFVGDTGVVRSGGALRLDLEALKNTGLLSAASTVDILVRAGLENSGRVVALGEADVSAGADFSQTGSFEAGKGLAFSIGGEARFGGKLLSGGGLRLTATDSDVSGTIVSDGSLELASSGVLTISSAGIIYGKGGTALRSGHSFTSAGQIYSDHDLLISATDLLSNSGTVEALQQTILQASDIVLGGNVLGTLISSSSSGSSAINGTLSSAGGIDIRARGLTTIRGTVHAERRLDLATAEALNISGTISTLGGGELSARTIAVVPGGAVLAHGDLGLLAVANISNQGTVATDGALALAYGGIFSNFGTVSSGGDYEVTAAGDYSSEGAIRAGGRIQIDARDISLTGSLGGVAGLALNGRNISLGAASDIESGTLLSVHAVGNLQADGKLLSLGDLSLEASSGLHVTGNIGTDGDAALVASAELVNSGRVESAGTLVLAGGALSLGGQLASANAIRLRGDSADLTGSISSISGLDFLLDGRLSANVGSVLVSNGAIDLVGRDLVLRGNIAGNTAIDLAAGNDLVHDGQIGTLGRVAIRAGQLLANSGNIAAQDSIAVESGAARIGGLLVSGAQISIEAGSLEIAGDISGAGAVSLSGMGDIRTGASSRLLSGDRLEFMAGTSLAIGGSVGSVKQLNLVSGKSIAIAGTIRSEGAATIAGHDIDVSGDVLVAGSAKLQAAEAFDVTGHIAAQSELGITAAGVRLSAGSQILASQSLILSSQLALVSDGLVSSASAVSLSGMRVAIGGKILSGGNLSIAGEGVTLGERAVLAADGTTSLSSLGALETSADIASNGHFTASALGYLVQAGTIRSAGTLQIAGASIRGGGSVLANGPVRFQSLSGDIDLSGSISSNGGISLSAFRDVSLAGSLGTGGPISLTASNLTHTGTIVSGGPTVIALSGAFTNTGTIASDLSIDISADTFDQASTGAIRNGLSQHIAVKSAAQVSGAITSAGDVTLEAASVGIGGSLTANGPISVLSRGGLLDIGAEALLASQAGLALSSASGLANRGTLQSGDALSLAAAGGLSTTGKVESLGRVSISGAELDLDGLVLANGALGAAATGALTVRGTISAQTNLGLDANALELRSNSRLLSDGAIDLHSTSLGASGLIGAGGPLVVIATGAVALSGTAASNGNVSVAGSSVAQTGSLFAGGSIALSSKGAVTNQGNIDALQAIDIASQGFSTSGRIASEGRASLNNLGGEAIFGGTVSGKGGVFVNSGGNALISGTLASGEELSVDVARDLSLTGTVSAAGTTAIAAGQAFQGSGTILSDGALVINAEQLDFSGRAAAAASVSLTAAAGPARISGSIEGSGITLLSSVGALDLDAGARLVSAGGLEVTAESDLAIGATLASNTGLTLNSRAGNINVGAGADVRTGGALTASAGLALDNGATLLSNGDIALSAALVNSGSLLSNAGIGISSLGILSITGPVDAIGAVNLQSRGASIQVQAGTVVASGGALRLNAAADIVNSGTLSGERQLDALAGGTISASGDIIARAGALNLGADRLDLDGFAYADGAVSLSATDIAINGTIGGNANLALAGNRLSILSRGLLQSNRTLSATVDEIHIDGTLRALSDAALAGTNVEIGSSGILEAGTLLSVNLAGRFDNAGRASANGNFLLSARQFGGSGILSAAGDIALSANSAAIDGPLEAGGTLSVAGADLSVATAGRLRATGAITVDGGTLAASGLIEAGGPIRLSANNDLFVPGMLRSNSDILLNGGARAEIGGSVGAGGSISIRATAIALSGAAGANGDLSLTAGTGGLALSGNLEAGGALSLKAAGGGLGIAGSGRILGGTVAADALSITNDGTLLSSGAITLAAGTSIDHNGTLGSNVLIRAAAGSKFSIGAAATIGAGSITLDGQDLDIKGALSSSGAINLAARGSLRLPGTVAALGPITLGGKAGSMADVSILEGGQLYSQSGIAIAQVRDVSVAGLISAGGPAADTSIAYQGILHVSGRIESGRDIVLEYRGDTNASVATADVGGQLVAGHDINIAGGSLLLTGLANALHDFNFESDTYRLGIAGAPVSLELAGTVHTDHDLSINAPGGVTIGSSALLSAGRDLRLTTGFTDNAGQINAGGALGISSRPDPAVGALPAADIANHGVIQSGGRLSLSARNALNLGTSGLILSNTSVLLSGSTIDVAGTIAAGDLVSVTGNGNVIIGGLIQSGRRIEIVSSGNVAISQGAQIETLGAAQTIGSERDRYSAANLGISAGGSLSNAGNLFSAGSIALKSETSTISNVGAGRITALGTAVLQADRGAILSQGAVSGLSAGSLALFQGQDFNNSGGFSNGGNLLISAPNINNSGGLLGAGGSLSLVASGSVTNSGGGTLFAGGDLAIGGASFTNDLSTVLAQGSISIAAGSVLNASARIESLGGDVRISTGQLDNRIKTLVIQPGEASSGAIYDLNGNFIATFDPKDCGVGCFILDGNIVILGNSAGIEYLYIPGQSSDDIVTTNTGASQIVATRDIAINATGIVTNSNSSILAGRNISITASTLNNLADILRTSRVEDVVEQQIVHFVDDRPCPTTAIPGTCRLAYFSTEERRQFYQWDEYADVVTGQQTVTEEVPLPTIIRAGATLSITANQVNNGTIANGAFTSSGSQIPGAGASGGTAQGGQASYSGTVNPGGGGITGQTGAVGVVDRRAASASQFYAVGGAASAKAVSGADLAANGAGMLASAKGAGASSVGPAAVDAAERSGTMKAQLASANGGYTSGGTGIGPVTPVQQNLTVSLSGNVSALTPGAGSADTSAATGAADPRSLTLKDVVAIPGMAGGGGGKLIDSVSSLSGAGGGGVASPMTAGLGGLAISGVVGADGEAGRFVFDFLRSFNLISSSGGFGFADGSRLFTFNDSPNADFLFTTNAGFSDVGGLYDSNYFFDRLKIDRNDHFTRLGDGFFEAQLIASQVREATGQAQLPEFGSALDQAAGLMQAALDAQKKLGLSLGVALTADQVKNLSSSLAWYVKANVNGHDVLVPIVYLAAADKKSISGGALLSGGNVVLNVKGDIRNGDVIAADKVVSLTAGNDIINNQGGLVRGGTIVASAARDILNQGAIRGGDLALSAGRDISVTAVTTTTSSSNRVELGKGRFTSSNSTATLISGSTIAASGNLALNAGRDLTIASSSVTAGSNAALAAGRDVTLTGANATTETDAAWKTGKKSYGTSTETRSTFVGSMLTAGGNLSIAAGNALTVKGSDIAAGGNIGLSAAGGLNIVSAQETASLARDERVSKKKTIVSTETAITNRLSTITGAGNVTLVSPGAIRIAGAEIAAGSAATIAGGSVSITGVVDTATLDSVTKVKKSGLLSKKVTTTTISNSDQSVVASAVTGDRVSIASTGDTAITGSNIAGTGNVALAAGGAIDIGTLAATSQDATTVKVKKSGISISGTGLFAGVAKVKNTTDVTTVANTGSLVGSATGNVTIAANASGLRSAAGSSAGALTITGSTVAAPGLVSLSGESVRIANATDTVTTVTTSKSSSTSFSIQLKSPVVSGLQTVARTAELAAGASSSRTQAVAAVAGGLAVKNTIDAVKNALPGATSALNAGDPLKAAGNLASLSISFGISKSSSSSTAVDQTAVGSSIAGGDVAIIAHGAGSASTISVTGSSISAGRDLTLAAPGAITLRSAIETDTSVSNNKSSGFSAGISIGASGITPSASVSFAKGNSSGTDVNHVESVLSAGGTAKVVTPGALTLQGAQLLANSVKINAGSLTIVSEQDTSTFASKDKSIGASLSLSPTQQLSGGINLGSTKQNGDFASVAEQSGVFAGSGGFDIRVTGATSLTGAVIASSAAPALNVLQTGSLTATDLHNHESYSASTTSIGVGIGANLGKDAKGNLNTDGTGNPLPGIHTGIGTISATPPVSLSASGHQAGDTLSAIAPGSILITGGDAASLNTASTISRDTSTANTGALTQAFTEAKRAEIAQGFEAVRILTNETATFFANRASDQKKAEEGAIAAGVERNADGSPTRDEQGNLVPLNDTARVYVDAAGKLRDTYGATSPARIIATALNGAAGSNVSGGLGSLVQGAAVNVLQSLAVTQVKHIADGLLDKDGNPTAGSEAVRAALQAVVGCAGNVAGGSNSCGSAATGAAASVVVNYLLTAFADPKPADGTPRTLEDQQARTNLVSSIVAAIATGAGLDAHAATTAAIIETENNSNAPLPSGTVIKVCGGADVVNCKDVNYFLGLPVDHPDRADFNKIVAEYGTTDPDELNLIVAELKRHASDAEIREQLAYNRNAIPSVGDGEVRIDITGHIADIRSNYDAAHGLGAYDALILQGRAENAAREARGDAAQAQLNREFGILILSAPAIAGGGVLALEGGSLFLAGNTVRGGFYIASGTEAVTGGTRNLFTGNGTGVFGYGLNQATGTHLGDYASFGLQVAPAAEALATFGIARLGFVQPDIAPPMAPIFGKGQVTGGTTHSATSERIAIEEALQADAVKVNLNQTIFAITNGEVKSGLRPDVCVTRSCGPLEAIEVLSPSNLKSGKTAEAYRWERERQFEKILGKGNVTVKVVDPDPFTPPSTTKEK